MVERRQSRTLDGSWTVIFDDANVGRELHWERADRFEAWPESEQVAVPACLEEYRLDYQGVAWYGRRFATPPEWAGCPMLLQFDAVNYRAEVWLNGEPAGAHDGGYTGFALEVGRLGASGRGQLSGRASDHSADHPRRAHRRPGARRDAALAWRDCRRHLAAGPVDRHRSGAHRRSRAAARAAHRRGGGGRRVGEHRSPVRGGGDAARHPAVGDAGQCGEQHADPGGATGTRHLSGAPARAGPGTLGPGAAQPLPPESGAGGGRARFRPGPSAGSGSASSPPATGAST